MRFAPLCILVCAVAACGHAANQPGFAFHFPAGNLGHTYVAIDAGGYIYMAGSVAGSPLTATPGAYRAANAGTICYGSSGFGIPVAIPCRNVFVLKLDPFGAVVFATYLGGSANVDASAIAVDLAGNVYVAGTVVTGDPAAFPLTKGAAFTTAADATANQLTFLAKLDPCGAHLLYSTLIPGVFGPSIAANAAGEVAFTAEGGFGTFPATANAYQTAPVNSASAAVVGKFSADGSKLLFGTYLYGTQGYSYGNGIAFDPDGNILAGGTTTAADFPATSGQFVSSSTGRNSYLARFGPGGTYLSASLLGPGSGIMAASPNGDVYFGVNSADPLPGAIGIFGATPGVGDYLVHLNSDLSGVVSSLYLPFTLNNLAVDALGNVYVAGSGAIPATAGAFLGAPLSGGSSQLVVVKVAPDGAVAGATYLGAPGGYPSIAAAADGSVVVAGGVSAYDPLAIAAPSFVAVDLFPALTPQNGANFLAGSVAPGELIALRGYSLGPDTGLDSAPTDSIGGVQVFFDNYPAPLIYAQSNQINVQAPWEIAGQTATHIRVVYNGTDAGTATAAVAPASPGVFYIENADGSMNGAAHPAHPGDFVSVYATGGGPMSAPSITGAVWPLNPLSFLAQAASATVGGEAANVTYAGSAPGLNDYYFQMNVKLPADLPEGPLPLALFVGGAAGAPAWITVQP